MVRIDKESDPEVLRQVALLLDRENLRLIERIKKLTEENSRLRGEDNGRLQLELEQLKELLARRNHALFAEKSERRRREDDTAGERSEPAPRRGHGPRRQSELPIQEAVHELPETERTCKTCGGTAQEWPRQFEDSEEVTVVERQFVVVKHRRKKYRCRCQGCVLTAPAPPKLKAGSRYSVDFAVEVAVSKYLDHMPLERQVRVMRREGLAVDSQTLWDQIETLACHLRPSYESLPGKVLGAPVVHADETRWRLMKKGGSERWWVWETASQEAVCYRIFDNRSHEAAAEMLKDYAGIVMADGYSAYEALARDGPRRFKLAHCWAHVRRKFVECEENFPEQSEQILDLIEELYRIERLVPRMDVCATEQQKAEALKLRAELRRQRSKPVVDNIKQWALAQRVLPESGLGRAIAYMMGMWKGLTAFLDDPRIPLDNNHAERALRGVVLGRKNHYGSRSRRGTEVAALFYSLMETARLAGVEPKSYLRKAALAAIARPGTITLPQDLLAN
ncbi:MAG: IS66 family transposase [Tepidiformaceae bacterium]